MSAQTKWIGGAKTFMGGYTVMEGNTEIAYTWDEESANKVVDALNAPSKRWCPVSEQPETSGWFLTSYMGCIPRVTFFEKAENRWFCAGISPTHWCLPLWDAPPKT